MVRKKHLVTALACALWTTSVLAITTPIGDIDGQVDDALGQPLFNAHIALQNQAGKTLVTVITDKSGHFHIGHLTPGVYAVVVSKANFAVGTDIVNLDLRGGQFSHITLASQQAIKLHVQASQINQTRNDVSANSGGSSSYHISAQDIDQMPQGGNAPFNQVLLQAPGVVQDSFGQLHVRGDHANLQYRINGVLLPESISGFGQTLDTRFIDSVNLLTGALSAQYGYRTAGVVDIHTKTGTFEQGGQVEVSGGNHDTGEASGEIMGHNGDVSYYFDASLMQNSLGIENPMPSFNAIHDASTQNKGFGYMSWTISDTLRASAIYGVSDNRFQIPDLYGQAPMYSLSGVANYPSQAINEQQHETTRYGLLALQGTSGSNTDYQLSAFSRYSRVNFGPDTPGDLIYTGVASQVLRTATENGLEADVTVRIAPTHTLRYGLFVSGEQINNSDSLFTFPANSAGVQTSTIPINQMDYSTKLITFAGVYSEDKWQATDKLTINYGMRFDQINAYVDGNQLSPRVSALYQLTPATVLHAGYAHYYTPPPAELISNQTVLSAQNTTNAQPGGTLNSPVQSESSDDIDIGINQHINPNLTMGLDGYYNHVSNLLDEGQFGSALLFTPFNYAQGKVYGIEFTSDYEINNFSTYFNLANSTALGKGIESAQYNFSPAELSYVANNWVHLDHDQTWTASSGVSELWQGTHWNADLIYGSGLRNGFANTSHLPSYLQINLGVLRSIMLPQVGQLNLRLAVLNALNTSYEIRDGTGIGVGAPQYGMTRTVILSLAKPF